jgi:hypothetical protein
VDVTGGDYTATSSQAVKLNGKSTGVEIEGKGGPGVKIKGDPNFDAQGTSKAMINSPDIDIGDKVIKVHGTEIEITGSTKITLSVGGSTIEISPAGVSVNGPKISLN